MITIIGALILCLCLILSILSICNVIDYSLNGRNRITYDTVINFGALTSLLWGVFYWYTHYFNY